MRVALVHDYLNQMGGAERVLLALHALYPDAPVYTSLYAPRQVDPAFRQMEIHTSFLQRLPLGARHHQLLLPLYPFAFEHLDLRSYDLILSSSSAFAKGVRVRPDAIHICYCHTPMRWAWDDHHYIERERLGPLARRLLPGILHRLRQWDEQTAQRVDHFIANSSTVARRIASYYRREATIIPPPIESASYTLSPAHEAYFLIVSRLVPYKRLDIAIEACNRLRLPLKIIGTGRDQRRLERLAGPTVELLGWLPDEQVRSALSRCRALIAPGEEDFGLAILEAQASGRPVIAYGAGGALGSISEGQSGLFFYEQTPAALAEVLSTFQPDQFDPQIIRRYAEAYDIAHFQQRIIRCISAVLSGETALQPMSLSHS
jgi:glycosyltransferase involved in cell wall biosynthesis